MNILRKLWGYIAAGSAFLISILLYKHEKNKRKQAEFERDIANDNVELLVKDKKIITDLDVVRENNHKKAAEMLNTQKTQLEKLKHEDDDSVVVDGIMRLLNKNDNKD